MINQENNENVATTENKATFKELNLHNGILQALEENGYTTPTPIQMRAIPKILEGLDIQASAQTGTGKTAAFILPALDRLTKSAPKRSPRVLILVPTRELAMQVANQTLKYSKHLPKIKTVCVFGGVPYPQQIRDLSRPYDILIATPGRLIDHVERNRIDLSSIEFMILDEADRMLDMGFIDPVEEIAALTPKNRQTLLFSATLKGEILSLSRRLLNKPIEISVAHDVKTAENIEERVHFVDDVQHKHLILNHLLDDPTMEHAIVFTSTKMLADRLVDKLYTEGYEVAALHGDMNQRQRTQTITRMRQGKIKILIATDVASRGIDISTISHIINFDLPNNAEDYVHRIGRTGRAGAKGVACSFVSFKDLPLLRSIEKYTGNKIAAHVIAGMEPKLKPTNNPTAGKFRPKRSFKPRRPGMRQGR
jgi:superfamily II DNA/RNA helicase